MIQVFFKTYGCQANVADSERLLRYLEDLGCTLVSSEQQADLIFVNSCAVRDKAEQKMFSYIGELAPYKRQKPYMRIGVIGCVASYRKKEMYERFSHINFVFGARDDMATFQTYLMDVITSLETSKQLYTDTGSAPLPGQDRDIKNYVASKSSRSITTPRMVAQRMNKQAMLPTSQKEVARSFINITTGCNNYCSFCIVPFTRGREISYSTSDLVDRARREVDAGAKEITLIGQNVNSYTDPDSGKKFASLLHEVAAIDGDFWVRFVSPHPKDMTRDVLEAMREHSAKLCGWVHLPLQSGSNRILEVMNRTYTVDRYMEIVDWIWELLPHATITTDIIVGFPDEQEEDYCRTRDVMERVRYDHIYSFVYSPRKYTKAYKLADSVSHELKQKRLEQLQARQKEICLERNMLRVGTKQRVLVEKRLAGGRLLARTTGNVRVLLDGGDDLIGTFATVLVGAAGPVNLEGSQV